MTSRKRILITILGVAVAFLLVWQFQHSPEWRHFSWQAVWTATAEARGGFIAASVALIYMSYVLRAWRWGALMSPKGRFWPVLKGTVVGFTGTALLGRPGELVRPYYIARKHRGDLSPQLAVWLLERLFDMAGVVLLVGLDLALSPGVKEITREGGYQAAFQRAGLILSAGIVGLIVALVIFHRRSHKILAKYELLEAKHRTRLRHRVGYFLHTLAQGTRGLTRKRTLVSAVVYTVLLWVVISASIYMAVRAYPSMLPEFSLSEGILLMGLTAIGSVAQLPAVGGGFQVLTIFGLTKLFGADSAAATSAALIIWLVCFYAIAPFGLGITAHEGISWRGIEHASIEAEAVGEEQG
ncbi:MAG TPA: lysylphosphatidylglycerol synthase transmembrane domain-containing protein [Terriglobales bacterium]|nr:lysylphosphatidylglycerol synthase transmembrane domain-containing protein [Terriglobales bacterium]